MSKMFLDSDFYEFFHIIHQYMSTTFFYVLLVMIINNKELLLTAQCLGDLIKLVKRKFS